MVGPLQRRQLMCTVCHGRAILSAMGLTYRGGDSCWGPPGPASAWPRVLCSATVRVRALTVPDTYEFSPPEFPDHRGRFVAPFQEPAFVEAVGHPLTVAQVNNSTSARGVIRGMHFARVPPGQAKYVYCPSGSLIDFVVDVRVGSPAFGRWDSVRLDGDRLNAVYLAEGVGHGFVALEDGTQATYLCSTGYDPSREHGFDPFDAGVGLPWPSDVEPVLSEKDQTAPALDELRAAGLLPDYADCTALYERLRSAAR